MAETGLRAARREDRPPAPRLPGRTRRARAAVGALFATNGAIYASVVPRYPDIQAHLHLTNAALGTAVSAFWLGALLVGVVGGALVGRWGSGRVATVVTLGACATLVVTGLAGAWWVLAAALFVAGSFDTLADIAENAHGLRVERRYRRSILNSLHGIWSIGAVTGGVLGSAAAGLGVPVAVHLGAAALACAVLAVLAARHLLRGPDRGPHRARTGTPPPGRRPLVRRGALLLGGVVVLGVFTSLAQSVEDVGATWSGLYLRHSLGAAPAVGGLAFVALQAAQTAGRLLGDRTVMRWGDRRVARCGAALAGTSVAVALLLPSPATTVAAFGAAGLGIATLIPAAMRQADALPGLGAGVGLSLVGSVSRVGGLVVPPVIGVLADAHGLWVALVAVPVAAALLLALAVRLPAGRPVTGSERGVTRA